MINNISLNIKSLENLVDISIDDLQQQFEYFNRRRKLTKQLHGFNTSPDKKESNKNFYLMTDYISGYKTVTESSTGKKKRVPIYKPLFKNIDEAFAFISNQRQVFTGLNHHRRDVVVVDIDQSYDPCFNEQEYHQRIIFIDELCSKLGIALPSYIEFHLDTGHCQVGWYLSEYFIDYGDNDTLTAQYKYLSRALAYLFKTDTCFRGGNIKNPYHCKNLAFFQSKDPVNCEEFLNNIRSNIDSLNLEDDSLRFPSATDTSNKIRTSPTRKKSVKTKASENQALSSAAVNSSRNVYALKKTTQWIFRQTRYQNGVFPSIDLVEDMFINFELESLPIVGKSCIEGISEIKASARGALNFCKTHYKADIADAISQGELSTEVQDKRRYFSKVKRQADKACRSLIAQYYKEQGANQLQISSILGCTQANVSMLLKQDRKISFIQLGIYTKLHEHSTDAKHLKMLEYIKNTLQLIGSNLYEVNYGITNPSTESTEMYQTQLKSNNDTSIDDYDNFYKGAMCTGNISWQKLSNSFIESRKADPRGDPFILMV